MFNRKRLAMLEFQVEEQRRTIGKLIENQSSLEEHVRDNFGNMREILTKMQEHVQEIMEISSKGKDA